MFIPVQTEVKLQMSVISVDYIYKKKRLSDIQVFDTRIKKRIPHAVVSWCELGLW